MAGALDLIALAEDLARRASSGTAGLWPRASALLGRQALEIALSGFWRATNAPLEFCSTRAQLACLRYFVTDPNLGPRTEHAWMALSRACHYHPYELAPMTLELTAALADVRQLVDALTETLQ